MTKIIHVAAGVITNSAGEILIAKRSADAHQGGLWEFPGGKLETGETATLALVRELEEELGIESTSLEPLIQIRHNYPDKSVLLDVLRVTEFNGEAHGKEGQPVRWVSPSELIDFEFPAANVPIVTAAQLPSKLMVTEDVPSVEDCVDAVRVALSKGIRLVQLRQRLWSDELWQAAVPKLSSLCREHQAQLILNSPKCELHADGWHLTSEKLRKRELPVKQKATQWLSASCHNVKELEMAQELGVDFVTLSPVESTTSHPEVAPLGWEQFERWVSEAKIPVFALGGMNEAHLELAKASGAQGIAGISAWR